MKNILLLGEALLRIDVLSNFYKLNDQQCKMFVGGSELNVASKLAENSEYNVKFTTSLPNNLLAEGVIKYMRSNGITPEIYNHEGRVGTYYHNKGIGTRNSVVEYDRKYSSYDLNPSFINKIDINGIDHFHVCGISAALSDNHQQAILNLVKRCKENNVTVSYDSNYRAKLWTQKKCGMFMEQIMPYVDILFAGKLDFIYLLNMDGSKSEEELLNEICTKYCNIKHIAFTNRQVINTSAHKLTGYIYSNNNLYCSDIYEVEVVDRIGGGDMYTGSILNYLISENNDYNSIVEKAIKNSINLHTYDGDYVYDVVVQNESKTGVNR